jgi:hypothetical protein
MQSEIQVSCGGGIKRRGYSYVYSLRAITHDQHIFATCRLKPVMQREGSMYTLS